MFEETKIKITHQQKTKFIMHWILLIVSHVLIFWYWPIAGNFKLYHQPQCDLELKQYYGCRNFQDNGYLRVFYILVCLYFMLSALQMRYGYSIYK